MKYILLSVTTILALLISSCELDNYDAPDARFFGAIIDNETGDTIPQDLIEGSSIDYIELGYANPQIQQLRFHVDGTFRNNLMFSGDYKIIPTRGNFFSPDTLLINIKKGDNQIDFKVRPYARIRNIRLSKTIYQGTPWLLAHFNVDQVATENIKEIMIAVDENPNVGWVINQTYFKKPLNRNVTPDEDLLLYIRIDGLTKGKKYYVRVGAIVDIPEARYNWCKAIQVDPFALPEQ